MSIFIKAGLWLEKKTGFKGEFNLTRYVTDLIAATPPVPPVASYKVFTALLTQSGIGDPILLYNLDPLTVGATYQITVNDGTGDFTNVGAPNNLVGTYFIATGVYATTWGNNSELTTYAGCPVATVIENTIGELHFSYDSTGTYFIYSEDLFILDKTTIFIGSGISNGGLPTLLSAIVQSPNVIALISSNTSNELTDGQLVRTSIEIRVYN
jgi:hypothetical protein